MCFGLKALSARVVRAAPDFGAANSMRAAVLGMGACPRSLAELKEAAVMYERAAAMIPAPALKADYTRAADWCRSRAEAM